VSLGVSALLGFPSALSRLARRQAPVFIGASILIALASAVSIGMAVYLRSLAIDENTRAATHVSRLVAMELDHSLQSVSYALSKVQERLQNAKSAAELDSIARGKALQSALQDQVAQVPLIARIAVVGADGGVVNDSADPPHDGVTVSPPMSQTSVDNLRRSAATDVSISSPVESGAGAPGIGLAKRISFGAGDDFGVVVAALAPSAIDDLIAPFVIGEHGSIALVRADGAIVDRVPAMDLASGKDIAADELDARYVSPRRDGVTQGVSAIDGDRRLSAVANLSHFPLAVVAAVATSDWYAGWLRQLEWIALRTVAVATLIAVGSVKLAISVDQLAEARKGAAVQAQMAIHYKRFSSAMDNIVQGVALFDADMRLITCNRRYAEIYDLPAEVTQPGAASAEGIFPRRRHAQFGDVSGERHTEADGSVATINELSDGRLILQRKKKLADGGWVSTHEDITARRRTEEKVREMATTDILTGLSNIFEFRQRLDQCLAEVNRELGKFAIFCLDLDRFKAVNDSLGHPLGDKLLKAVSQRIVSVVRVEDTVARIGGDQFAVIQRVSNTLNDPARLADRLIAAVGEPHRIGDAAITIGVSIGISVAPKDGVVADELIRAADVALYHAKAERRGGYAFFEKAMDEQVQGRRHMEDDLRTALAEGQFHLNFQPVVSATDRVVKSFEALLRWRHPIRGNIAPSEFIPLAEEVGLIAPIGEWVIREACKQAAKWPRHVKLAVNVSAAQFKSPALVPTILDAIASSRIASSRLIVEVTESVMIGDTGQAIAILHQIRDQKIMIAMDDFGTGYASLGYLRRFPFDEIKIDRSFVSELGRRDDSVVIVRAIISLAKALGIATVAEGVENEDQFACLKTEGCDEIQGYLISRPMPADDVLTFLGREGGAAEGEGEGAPRPAPL
jgi:diguanylate cyclase (GGDEF)-like protein